MNLPGIAHTFVFVLVFALAATGVWASGESDQPAAAAEKEMVLDPRTGGGWWKRHDTAAH